MEYSFNIEHAEKYGVEEAIMIRHFQFWITKNRVNERHFYDGRTWTYNSVKAFCQIFPFWSTDQIRRIIISLKAQGVLISGKYNQSSYDQTLWYAFYAEDEWFPEPKSNYRKSSFDFGESQNQNGETAKSNKEAVKITQLNNTDIGTSSSELKKPEFGPPVAAKQGNEEKKDKADPQVKEFIDHAYNAFKKKTGDPLCVDGGKDGAIIKKLLGTYGLEKLKGLWDVFMQSTDPFIEQAGRSIGVFKSQVNKLLEVRLKINPDTCVECGSTEWGYIKNLEKGPTCDGCIRRQKAEASSRA